MRLSNWPASHIDSRVYLGNLESAQNLPRFITHVISVMSDKPHLHPSYPERKHLFICAEDDPSQDLLSKFRRCYDFIRKALEEDDDNRVLIHCQKGRSRSATIAMMYLMRKHHWTYDEAKKHLKKKRPEIHINEGFKAQLRYFSKLLKEFNAQQNHSTVQCQKIIQSDKNKKPIKTGAVVRSPSCEIYLKPVPVPVPVITIGLMRSMSFHIHALPPTVLLFA